MPKKAKGNIVAVGPRSTERQEDNKLMEATNGLENRMEEVWVADND